MNAANVPSNVVCRRHFDEHVERRAFRRLQRELSDEFFVVLLLASAVAVAGKALIQGVTIL